MTTQQVQELRVKTEKKWLEPWLNLPVVCPECGTEERFAVPLGVVAEALLKSSALELYVSCHDIYWYASPAETERARATLREVAGVSIERVPAATADEAASACTTQIADRAPATGHQSA